MIEEKKPKNLKIGIAVQRTTQFITSHPVEAFGLKGVTAGIVKLSPASSSTAIYRLCGGRGEKKGIQLHTCDRTKM